MTHFAGTRAALAVPCSEVRAPDHLVPAPSSCLTSSGMRSFG